MVCRGRQTAAAPEAHREADANSRVALAPKMAKNMYIEPDIRILRKRLPREKQNTPAFRQEKNNQVEKMLLNIEVLLVASPEEKQETAELFAEILQDLLRRKPKTAENRERTVNRINLIRDAISRLTA